MFKTIIKLREKYLGTNVILNNRLTKQSSNRKTVFRVKVNLMQPRNELIV